MRVVIVSFLHHVVEFYFSLEFVSGNDEQLIFLLITGLHLHALDTILNLLVYPVDEMLFWFDVNNDDFFVVI